MRPRPLGSALLQLGGCGLVVAGLSGCPAPLRDHATWGDQLAPGGPCYDANLLDGLDEASTQELHDVFACLDGSGALDAFAPIDVAFDAETRDGPAGLVIAHAVNGLGGVDVPAGLSLAGLVADARDLLEDPEPVLDAAHVALELAWGVPWPALEAGADVRDPALLDASLVDAALPVVADVATTLIDEPTTFLPLRDALRADELRDLAWSVAAAADASDPALARLATAWPDDLVNAVARSRDRSNDRWDGASGDSLRDLLVLLAARQDRDGRVLLSRLADDLLPLVDDAGAVARLRAAVAEQVAYGRLDALPVQVVYLTSVDGRGGSLDGGEDSALTALLRLLATTNTEVVCEVPGIGLDVEVGNLAVALLQAFADLDPDNAVGGVELLSTVLGFGLTDSTLELVADQCPSLDEHFVDDVHSIDRLVDPSVGDLLRVLLAVLDAIDSDAGGEGDHIPDLADAVSTAWRLGIVPPAEEAVRDLADTPLVAHVVDLVPVLLEPDEHYDLAVFPAGVRPVSWETLFVILPAVLGPGADGVAPLDRMYPLTGRLLLSEATWTLLDRAVALLADPRALVRGALGWAADALEQDPHLDAADAVADALDSPGDLRPALVLVEAPGVRSAVVATSADRPGPLPTVTTWVVGDTLAIVLDTLRALASLLPEPE